MKKILLLILMAVCLICGYLVVHYLATLERGYNATGGEIFIFLVPFLICAIKDTVTYMKARWNDEN